MALNNFDDLNPMHMDVLREIGNIGSGNSATSLSQILSSEIDIGVPVVRDLEYNEVIDLLGGPEQVLIGLLVRLSGDIKGMMMYLLKENFANKVTTTFYGKEITDVLQLDEMDRSAICEMGNIMASSYVNAIAQPRIIMPYFRYGLFSVFNARLIWAITSSGIKSISK